LRKRSDGQSAHERKKKRFDATRHDTDKTTDRDRIGQQTNPVKSGGGGSVKRELGVSGRTLYQRMTAPPQVIPAPIAIMAMTSPFFSRPARFASSRVIGIEALDVLP